MVQIKKTFNLKEQLKIKPSYKKLFSEPKHALLHAHRDDRRGGHHVELFHLNKHKKEPQI